MYNFETPKEVKIGEQYTTSWSNNPFLKWTLIDITNNIAYLKDKKGNEINTHVNNLRKCIRK